MHTETVEILSDDTNMVVLRHPTRRIPSVVIQGDSLYSMCKQADHACAAAQEVLPVEPYTELKSLRNSLWALLTHYKTVLAEHDLSLPFSEVP
jgi:hypothetical protein